MPSLRSLGVVSALVTTLLSGTAWADSPCSVASPNGDVSLSFGFLAQGLLQQDLAAGAHSTTDLYFRRLRFIAGGHVTRRLTFFVESDTAYLGHHGNDGWSVPPTIVQDAFITYELSERLQIDAGLLLVPVSYNSTQSAASLLPVAYGPYSFLSSSPTQSRVGRDQGFQVRGYLFSRRLELRAGAFRGARKDNDALPYRYAARAVWYFVGSQTGFFYPGTQHGRSARFGVGGSVDHQERYRAYALDLFAERPRPNGDTITAQLDIIRYDGGQTFRQLARQHTWLAECGYTFKRSRLGPFVQVAGQEFAAPAAASGLVFQGGVAYWFKGHTANLKLAAGRTIKGGTPSHTQVAVQSQVFVY